MSAFRIANTNVAPTPKAKPSKSKGWMDKLFVERPAAMTKPCKACQRTMYIPPSKIDQVLHCSRECIEVTKMTAIKVKPWAHRIFEKREGTVSKECEGCKLMMHLPPSKADRRFCTLECRTTNTKERMTKVCAACRSTFEAWNNNQKYCSQKCNASSGRISSPENLIAAQEGRRRAVAEGRIEFKSGPDNPLWKGGPKALLQRQIASGKTAAWTRRYRKENPDKVREFSDRRKNRKRSTGRLPRGTIVAIRNAQKIDAPFAM